jgi:predicted regulator of Ras-like GTPase activity (Roadblock/LC7/MglB family)
MEDKLTEMNSIKGVWGYFVCDNMGRILAREMPIVFMKHLAMVGKEVTQVIGLLENLSRSPENLELLFEDGRVMIMSLKNFTLVVFCDPNVDIPMLRSKMDVVISEITQNSKMQELFQKGEWRRRRLLQKEYLNREYREILDQLVPDDMNPSTSA